MIAIVNRRPMQLGLIDILDAYINHQIEVVTKRTRFDLDHAKSRYHIVEGLIKAISILDDVVKTIRASKNKQDAIENLVIKYGFTKIQAEEIVNLQLYRLTNTDILVLTEEKEKLEKLMEMLEGILASPEKLRTVIKEELRRIKKEYGTDRKTEIQDEVEEIKIDQEAMIPKEDVVVVISSEGYIKRVSQRSYLANKEDPYLKEDDYIIGMYNVNTLNTILLFTDKGNYLYLPVYEIPEIKWKELGKHVSNIISMTSSEKIIASIPVYDFNEEKYVTIFTKNGMIKRTELREFKVSRYAKEISMIKLKDDDRVVSISTDDYTDVFVVTRDGYGLWYDISEVSVVGIRASGVKSIKLKNDEVVCGVLFDSNQEYISIIMDKGTAKRLKLSEISKTTRGNRGILLMKEIKSNPSKIVNCYILPCKQEINVVSTKETKKIKLNEISIMDRQSNGSFIVKDRIVNTYLINSMDDNSNVMDEPIEVKSNKELDIVKKVDNRIMTIDDLLDNIENK